MIFRWNEVERGFGGEVAPDQPPRRLLHRGLLGNKSAISGLCHGGIAEGFARLLHLGLEGLARRFPGLLLEGHFATAQSLARVLARILAATALAFARIVALAGVRVGQGAVAHPGAGIVSSLALPFAGVETAADMFLLQQ